MARWTTNDIPDQTGKIAIVTGANTGIGHETALALGAKGATVIMANRSEDKSKAAVQRVLDEVPGASIEWLQLDLADLSSIRTFAEEFTSRHDQLHMLINNAGVMMVPDHRKTADGFEMTFGTNHLGHFALTGLLLDVLIKTPGSRVVTVSSGAHTMGRMDFENLNAERSYNRMVAYGESKVANLLFTYELQRRLKADGNGVMAVAAHPGWTATDLQRYSGVARFLNPLLAMPTPRGALPTLRAATAPDVSGGEYYGPDGFREMRGWPTKVGSNALSRDETVAKKLWDLSEEWTGISYEPLQN